MAVLLAAGCGALAAGGRGQDHIIRAAAQRFMLSYPGVFALIALTAAVAAGLVATDNIVMAPAGRVVSLAVHRALSLAGFAALPGIPATAVTAGQQSTWRSAPPLPPHRALPHTIQHGTQYNGPHHGSQHSAIQHHASQHSLSPHHGTQHGSFRQLVEPR